MTEFNSGIGRTVQIGYINKHDQKCLGTHGKPGTDFNALVCKMQCTKCKRTYGANLTDVHQRHCPCDPECTTEDLEY